MDFVFLIQEREFIRMNEETYTIGGSSDKLEQIMKAFPRGSRLIYYNNVSDCHKVHANICAVFDHMFERQLEYGDYCYSGKLDTMKKEFMICILNDVYGAETEIVDLSFTEGNDSESKETKLRRIGRTSVMRLKEDTKL
jgi:hypothetical protein